MTTKRRTRDLAALLENRGGGPLLGILYEEGLGLRKGLRDTLAGCDCDFDLLIGSSRAARKTLKKPRWARETSPEWIDLRITLEHLVYYTARLQLFLSGALADAAAIALSSDPTLRPTRGAAQNGAGLQSMVEGWHRLRKRRVAQGNVPGETRLLADAALFVGSANLQSSKLLIMLLEGTL